MTTQTPSATEKTPSLHTIDNIQISIDSYFEVFTTCCKCKKMVSRIFAETSRDGIRSRFCSSECFESHYKCKIINDSYQQTDSKAVKFNLEVPKLVLPDTSKRFILIKTPKNEEKSDKK